MSPPTEDRCLCGHVEDEHEDSWKAPCDVDGCDCDTFAPVGDDE